MITFNNIVERFEIFAQNHFFIKTFSFGSPDDADLSKFTDFPLMHLVYTGASYDAGTKTYNIEVYILDVPADKNDKVERQKEVVSDAEQCAEDIIADIKNGGNIFLFAQDYEVVNATTTPLEEETKNVLSGVLLDLSVAIPYEWDACNAPIDGVEPGGTEVTYARRGVLRMLTIDGTTDVQSVRTINVTNGTLTDNGDGVVTLDTGGAETLNDLTDVDTTGVTDGQVLKYDNASGEWLPGNDQSATSLGNLDDVSIVTPANREALIYDGSEWVNDTVAKGDIGLGNVDNTSDADKPVSAATQTALNAKANTADVPTSLNDLSDVSIVGTPTGNQALIYDATANAFKSQASYTNRFEDEVETGKEMPTIFAERAYSVKSEGDGIFIDPESDTPAAGKVIVRKIYHKTGFITDADVIGDYTLIHTFADDTDYADTVATFEGFRDGNTYGTPPFTLLQTWEEVAAAPTFTGLLNESYGSGAAAAYGTRRLNGNYSGACMTIRRASDGTTQAIGFVGEEIDESAITTFCTGTTCTVQVWHDQSQTGGTGSGNDATQTTPANQPTIYTGGQLVKEGGRLALDFDGSNDSLTPTSTLSSPSEFSTFIIATPSATLSGYRGLYAPDNGASSFMFLSNVTNTWGTYGSGNQPANSALAVNSTALLSMLSSNGDSGNFYKDGLSDGSFSSTTGQPPNIGGQGNQLFPGTISEIIAYPSDKSSFRTSIEGNISAYYQSAKLLDEQFGSGAEAAYSVRQLKRDNTECMVIRRASDSTTTTIGFDASGNIDEAAITTFCTGTTCTVYQWLDQSGNGNTATAASTGVEPTIYTGGALVKENGRVGLDFDGTNDQLETSATFSLTQPAHQFGTGKINSSYSASTNYTFASSDVATNRNHFFYRSTGKYAIYSGSSIESSIGTNSSQFVFSALFNSPSSALSLNGSSVASGDSGSYNFGGNLLLGNQSGNFPWYGVEQEFIMYNSDKSGTDQTSIEENIGDYFTQNTPLLDTYSGAAAAYSLRLLDSTYTGSAIRVRRSSDNAEQDIGFNVFGELDTVSLLAFAGTGDAFVKTWYDQASTNDATQTTTANQPKIVSSGAVITENGKPAVEFDGALSYFPLVLSGININNLSSFGVGVTDLVPPSANGDIMLSLSGGSASRWYTPYTTGTNFNYGYGSSSTANSIASDTNQHIFTMIAGSTQGNMSSFLDGTSVGTATLESGFDSSIQLSIGSYNVTTHAWPGRIQEIVVYASDESSNRTGIETNVNTFYSIF